MVEVDEEKLQKAYSKYLDDFKKDKSPLPNHPYSYEKFKYILSINNEFKTNYLT